MKENKCKMCGCTDRRACVMGCSWVNPDRTICSACYQAWLRQQKEKPMSKKKKTRYVYRSAVTGKFVSAAYAKRYPHRTMRQRVK